MQNYPSFRSLITGNIYKVSELTLRIKEIVSREIGNEFIWVVGEVTGFRNNFASGHWYFSLRDDNSQISAVCFKWANQFIKFVPENGMEVICCGQVDVYEKQGIYQLIVRYIEPRGVGSQAIALEQLKQKLESEGLFAPERKKQIPFLVRKIGIVTSPTGAAIRDILKVIYRRFPNVETIISTTRVQGDKAPQEIIKALDRLYSLPDIDLIIIARGGGSKEDLWVFNEEVIARKVSQSPVPIISAVGHQTDYTICDMVSDVRASTPSMAAELAVKEKTILMEEIKELQKRLALSLVNRTTSAERELDELSYRLKAEISRKQEKLEMELSELAGRLDSLSPLKVLERGYSITYKADTLEVVKDSKDLFKGEKLLIQLLSGKVKCTVDDIEP